MKKLLIIILVSSFASIGAQAQVKVAFTNVELIMSIMPEMKEISQKVGNFEAQLEKQLEVKTNYYQQKAEEYYAKKKLGMTPADEKKLIDEIAKLEEEIRATAAESDNKVLQMQMKLMQPVQIKLQDAINAVTKERGYDYAINQVIGDGVPTILYGHPDHDITEDIMTKLGIKKPKEEGAATEK